MIYAKRIHSSLMCRCNSRNDFVLFKVGMMIHFIDCLHFKALVLNEQNSNSYITKMIRCIIFDNKQSPYSTLLVTIFNEILRVDFQDGSDPGTPPPVS